MQIHDIRLEPGLYFPHSRKGAYVYIYIYIYIYSIRDSLNKKAVRSLKAYELYLFNSSLFV